VRGLRGALTTNQTDLLSKRIEQESSERCVLADADSQGGSAFLTYFLHSHILFATARSTSRGTMKGVPLLDAGREGVIVKLD
jgi:hypothetical protein